MISRPRQIPSFHHQTSRDRLPISSQFRDITTPATAVPANKTQEAEKNATSNYPFAPTSRLMHAHAQKQLRNTFHTPMKTLSDNIDIFTYSQQITQKSQNPVKSKQKSINLILSIIAEAQQTDPAATNFAGVLLAVVGGGGLLARGIKVNDRVGPGCAMGFEIITIARQAQFPACP